MSIERNDSMFAKRSRNFLYNDTILTFHILKTIKEHNIKGSEIFSLDTYEKVKNSVGSEISSPFTYICFNRLVEQLLKSAFDNHISIVVNELESIYQEEKIVAVTPCPRTQRKFKMVQANQDQAFLQSL